jgi:hypothetical protein
MIRRPETFHADPPASFDGQFHWDYLIPAFKRATGRNIEPMDIDCHVEIGGNHLVIETKDLGVPVPAGQRDALLQLWAKGYHTVIFLWGKVDPLECEIYYPGGRKRDRLTVTTDEMIALAERWARWADRHRCPFQYNGQIAKRRP